MLGVVALARLIPVITGLLLFAVGLDLTGADLRRVRKEPRLLLAGRLAPPLLRAPLALGPRHFTSHFTLPTSHL
jgi:predicted Na+-dependent transporter